MCTLFENAKQKYHLDPVNTIILVYFYSTVSVHLRFTHQILRNVNLKSRMASTLKQIIHRVNSINEHLTSILTLLFLSSAGNSCFEIIFRSDNKVCRCMNEAFKLPREKIVKKNILHSSSVELFVSSANLEFSAIHRNI